MWQMVAVIAAAVAILAGAFTAGSHAGHAVGERQGHARGYEAATASLGTTHRAMIDQLNREAAEGQLAAERTEQVRRDEETAVLMDARNVAVLELHRVAGDRDDLARRVHGLLAATARTASDQSGVSRLPRAPRSAPGDEATAGTGLLLDRVGTALAALASDADITLAQYTICYRLAMSQKRQLHGVMFPQVR